MNVIPVMTNRHNQLNSNTSFGMEFDKPTRKLLNEHFNAFKHDETTKGLKKAFKALKKVSKKTIAHLGYKRGGRGEDYGTITIGVKTKGTSGIYSSYKVKTKEEGLKLALKELSNLGD